MQTLLVHVLWDDDSYCIQHATGSLFSGLECALDFSVSIVGYEQLVFQILPLGKHFAVHLFMWTA